MGVSVCAPAPTVRKRSIGRCPGCRVRRWFVWRFFDWYGWHSLCCGCGREWACGELVSGPSKKRASRGRTVWRDRKEPTDG